MNDSVLKLLRPLVLVCVLVGLSACQERFEWNEKLTVTVETPAGEVSGSAVVRQVSHLGQMPMAANAVSYEITGEATVVEVAPGKYFFALLNGVEERAVRTFKPEGMTDPSQYFAAAQNALGAKPLRGPLPTLVTFEDINDPKTVKLVDPTNLASTFGPGFALKSITLEITDEKVTDGRVEKLLGWWCEFRAEYFVDRYAPEVPNEFARNVGGSDFRRAKCQ
jgi:hypothetical protein